MIAWCPQCHSYTCQRSDEHVATHMTDLREIDSMYSYHPPKPPGNRKQRRAAAKKQRRQKESR